MSTVFGFPLASAQVEFLCNDEGKITRMIVTGLDKTDSNAQVAAAFDGKEARVDFTDPENKLEWLQHLRSAGVICEPKVSG